MTMTTSIDRAALKRLADGSHADPFAVLGRHDDGDGPYIRAVLPGAESVEAIDAGSGAVIGTLAEIDGTGVFEGPVRGVDPYRLKIRWPGGVTQESADPYSFSLLLGELDLHLLGESRHFELASALGANVMSIDGVEGVRFAVWAPNAKRVAIVGDFNTWDRRRHPMRVRFPSGVWELFVPGLKAGERYKFAINGPDGAPLADKADPVAKSAESAPGTASVVAGPQAYAWTDDAWMAARGQSSAPDKPLSFYEVHLGSWLKDGRQVDWSFAIEKLIPYAAQMGFTHIELLPVAEHPFGGSWGYQPLGLFAPTGRYGSPDDFARFVDAAHAAGVGVVVDWVPAHFPTDPHGLYRFDGTPLYEHADPREGFHIDWNTAIYNFGRREVQNFLIASGLHWLEQFHVDGLRVDAVASMLYRDYSRKEGEWVPNHLGGRENLEAIGFLQHFNAVVRERVPGAITIAEESTAWPGVTRSTTEGGLGFHYKWNMGWMHDTLNYMEQNPIYRSYNHDGITFGLVYAFSEKFVLPLSHDEVVHGKGSLINKMPGDTWQKFANLRSLYGLMWSHPGKKLLFMGGEIAQWTEWNHDGQVDWPAIDDPAHVGVQRLVRDLNRTYAAEPALHRRDCEESGFRWVIGDDRANSVFAFRRLGENGDPQVLVVANMTPVPRHEYRIGVPTAGRWSEIINTDSAIYGGSNVGNSGAVETAPVESHGEAQSLLLSLPPLAVIALRAG